MRVDPVICVASGESGHRYVRPPKEFLNPLKSASKTSDIIVTYVGFPDSVKAAFERAVEIWESLLSSPVPIYMLAEYKVLNSQTLGSCGAQYYYINFDNAPLPDTYYPVALAEKIMEREITGPDNYDIMASFNSSIPWYFGTDGQTPFSKYDFVSTVLHEIAHGLGFIGFFKANLRARTGSYGYNDNLPAVFDRRVENQAGGHLADKSTYWNPSMELYSSMVSDQLYADSPAALTLGDGERPRLYAPQTFKEGSSIYHLNDQSYPYGTSNALMTHAAGMGEAIHNPGPLTLGILADIGWKYLFFRFALLKDVEEIVKPLKFEVNIDSDLGVDKKGVRVIWSSDQFVSHRDTLVMTANDNGFSVSLIPSDGVRRISYYLQANDTLRRSFTFPVNVKESFFSLFIGKDTVKPVISHQPVKYLLQDHPEFEIVADITDNLGIDTVQLFFYVNGTPLPAVGIGKGSGNLFRKRFAYAALGARPGDSISYVIQATDAARSRNIQNLPVEGKFSFRVEEYGHPITRYTQNFNSATDDFILVDFEVQSQNGFDNGALHSPHPYLSPERDNASLDFVTILRYPVIVSESTKMSFDEVVLVEPGDTGAGFGSDDFFDFVIVEGSRDFGKSWLPLLNGYDSSVQQAWLSNYTKRILDGNSMVNGSKDLFFSREFSLTQNKNFKAGDTLLVRFRIYSDPYAHGWGWAIDNLKIEQNITFQDFHESAFLNVHLWPNPAGDFVHLSVDHSGESRDFSVQIRDLAGRMIFSVRSVSPFLSDPIRIDLDQLHGGVYFVILTENDKILAIKKLIKR